METTKEILRLEFDIKHEELFLNNRIKELEHLKDTIKESEKRLKKFKDELNALSKDYEKKKELKP